jgi:O-antigen ligase
MRIRRQPGDAPHPALRASHTLSPLSWALFFPSPRHDGEKVPEGRMRGFSESYLPGLPLPLLQDAMLWLFIAAGCLVFVEPSPYEMLFPLLVLLFLPSGLSRNGAARPLVAFLLLYNFGGAAGLVPFLGDDVGQRFVAISCFMGLNAVFFAALVANDTERRLRVIRSAWIMAALFASVAAILGYFDVAGTAAQFAPVGRAQGTFKDPNVYATFLAAPIVFLVQLLMTGASRRPLLAALCLLVLLAGLFLSFSRGGWAVAAGSVLLMAGLTFMTTADFRLRSRILISTFVGAILVVALAALALTVAPIREVFLERWSLAQSYDVGETGRFGNQLNAIPLLLDSPNGMGPQRFYLTFGSDPHNVYVNAFASYGWLGGLSYLLLIAAALTACWNIVFTPSPWRRHAIAVAAPLVLIIVQGFQIDTDHWRHFYLLLGLVFGLLGAVISVPAHRHSWSESAHRAAAPRR